MMARLKKCKEYFDQVVAYYLPLPSEKFKICSDVTEWGKKGSKKGSIGWEFIELIAIIIFEKL